MPKLIFLGGEDVSARIEISKKFISLGYEIEIIGTQSKEVFNKSNIPYRKYLLSRELNIINDIKTIIELRRILKKQNYGTIVHAFDTKPTMYLPIAGFGLKNVYIVRTITGMGRIFTDKSFKNSVLKFVYNFIQKIINIRVDKTIFQNDDDYAYYLTHKLLRRENAVVIKSSGLNLSTFATQVSDKQLTILKEELKFNSNQRTIILVSRMVKQKGILDYLEAARLCYENGYSYNFLLVGQLDSDNSITIDEINEYKQYISYLGRREDVKELLILSDIFVLPTYYREGVPRVLLEASALGLSLITTDMPGCKDVVKDEYNGKLVNIKDSNDLYEKIVYIAENEELMDKFSRNAKEKVKEFDLDKIVSGYNKVYKNIGEN